MAGYSVILTVREAKGLTIFPRSRKRASISNPIACAAKKHNNAAIQYITEVRNRLRSNSSEAIPCTTTLAYRTLVSLNMAPAKPTVKNITEML